MEEIDWESRIDNVRRDDIWQKPVKEWLDTFKSEYTPIEKRIKDYQICGWSVGLNNEEQISIAFQVDAIPVDENNTEWEKYRMQGFIDMVNEDGEYKVTYLSDVPKDYDKFMEAFEEWKKTNSSTETLVTQGENKNLSSAQEQEINIMSTSIVAGCTAVLIIIGVIAIFRIVKHLK